MHSDRHFNSTQTERLHRVLLLIAGLIVVIGASACSTPAPANAVEPAPEPVTTETTIPSLLPEPLRTVADVEGSDSSTIVLETLPTIPADASALLEITAPESTPSRWILNHIDVPNSVRFSQSRSGDHDKLKVSGTTSTTLADIEAQLQADGWTTRSTTDSGILASQGDTAAELTTIDVLADGSDLDITIAAPSGMLDLGWVHEWWTEPLNNAGIDGTLVRLNVRWQTTGQCDGCTFTRLSVTVDAGDLGVSELADRLAATGSGWTFTEESGWLFVTSPDGQNLSIGSELGELSATIESQANVTDAAETTEETEEQSFGDYVCWHLAGEITDLDGAATWEEFAAPMWDEIAADQELSDMFDNDPIAFTGHVEASASEACSGLAESFADGSGRELVERGYDSTVTEDE